MHDWVFEKLYGSHCEWSGKQGAVGGRLSLLGAPTWPIWGKSRLICWPRGRKPSCQCRRREFNPRSHAAEPLSPRTVPPEAVPRAWRPHCEATRPGRALRRGTSPRGGRLSPRPAESSPRPGSAVGARSAAQARRSPQQDANSPVWCVCVCVQLTHLAAQRTNTALWGDWTPIFSVFF